MIAMQILVHRCFMLSLHTWEPECRKFRTSNLAPGPRGPSCLKCEGPDPSYKPSRVPTPPMESPTPPMESPKIIRGILFGSSNRYELGY